MYLQEMDFLIVVNSSYRVSLRVLSGAYFYIFMCISVQPALINAVLNKPGVVCLYAPQ